MNRSTHFKGSATASTKIPTKYDKITLSNPSIGLRGLSIKYDVGHKIEKELPSVQQERLTEAFSRSGIKLAGGSGFTKGIKRYQSAQKFRPKETAI